MKKTLLFLALLLLSGSAAAQGAPSREQLSELQPAQNLIQVQWLLIGGASQQGSVFNTAKPDSGLIGDWYDLPLYQGIPPPCVYCRNLKASRIHYFDILAAVNIPGNREASCRLFVEVDESRVMRTGNNVLAGRWVSIVAVDSNQWEVMDGGGWLVQDDNHQWRLSVTLTQK